MFKFLTFGLLAFFLKSNTFCQTKLDYERYITVNNGGVCTASLFIYNDKTYCLERDCEASSHLSFGMWEQTRDSLKFHPFDNKDFKVIQNITSSKISDNLLNVSVFDLNGNNVTDKVSVGQFVRGKGIYMMKLDSTEKVRTDFIRDSGTIVLKSLEKIFQQKLEIIPNTNNFFKVTLNISCDCFYDTYSDWGGYGDFTLIKRDNKLISVQANKLDIGNTIGTEYTREK